MKLIRQTVVKLLVLVALTDKRLDSESGLTPFRNEFIFDLTEEIINMIKLILVLVWQVITGAEVL